MTTQFQPPIQRLGVDNYGLPEASLFSAPLEKSSHFRPIVQSQFAQTGASLRRNAHPTNPDQNKSLNDDIHFLLKYGFDFSFLRTIQQSAKRAGVEAHQQLIASRNVPSETYFRLLAQDLTLPFLSELQAEQITPHFGQRSFLASLRHGSQILLHKKNGNTVLVMCPDTQQQRLLRAHLKRAPHLKSRLALADPASLQAALLERVTAPIERHATTSIGRHMPVYSALKTTTRFFISAFTVMLLCLPLLLIFGQHQLMINISITASLIFFVSLIPRLLAAIDLPYHKAQIPKAPAIDESRLPVYSILIALYKEADVVPDLIKAIDALDWPEAKLDIKLLLEADDYFTKEQLEKATQHHPKFEILVVPDGPIKTKPRALNYGLALARGDFVVIYDAEDRPDPRQLKEAYCRFKTTGQDTACVQAPLVIDNARRRWLSTMFEIEYAALFDGLLPALASWRAPILLGGTSNHFRIDVLRGVGAWDPHNVTEDADLGIRLKRFGHDIEMIDAPTYEEAPDRFIIWLKQRTRWFKGWMQTTIVHARHPRKTMRQLGLTRFLSFHFHSSLLLFSALGHPFFLIFLISQIFMSDFAAQSGFVYFLASNLLLAYLIYALLSHRALAYRNKRHLTLYCLTLPAYWLLLSVAAWRALFQLIYAPHLWEKTPHGTIKRRTPPWVNVKKKLA